MATEITMPQLSDTMDQGTILKWFKKVGDAVSRGDALAEVATDKADLEIESFDEGTLLEIKASEGDTVKVGALIAVIGMAGEVSSGNSSNTSSKSTASENSPSNAPIQSTPVQNIPSQHIPEQNSPALSTVMYENKNVIEGSSDSRLKASPLARNIAKSHGLDLSQVSGSGDGGRITKKDVEKLIGLSPEMSQSDFSGVKSDIKIDANKHTNNGSCSSQNVNTSTPSSPLVSKTSLSTEAKSEPLSRMRQTIASRMVESVVTAPHFYATSRIEVDNLLKTRELLKTKAEYEGVTVTHLVTKAVGICLRKFPRINSRFEDNTIVQPASVNIGIITALPDGLLIPVIKNVDTLSLLEVVQESRGLVQRARAGKPKADDLQGGTFSISNIGKNEVEHFTAIINPGQGAILAVSSIQDEALVKNGAVVPAKTMRVTISVDHRIIDGVMAGEFLTSLKEVLEEPVLLFA